MRKWLVPCLCIQRNRIIFLIQIHTSDSSKLLGCRSLRTALGGCLITAHTHTAGWVRTRGRYRVDVKLKPSRSEVPSRAGR